MWKIRRLKSIFIYWLAKAFDTQANQKIYSSNNPPNHTTQEPEAIICFIGAIFICVNTLKINVISET